MRITLREPDGREQESPDITYVKNLILNPKTEYWRAGSGDLGIYYYGIEISILILVYCEESKGFFIQLYPKIAPDDWLIAFNNSELKKYVIVSYGGNESLIPDYVIMSPENTFEIVEHYLRYGDNLEKMNWKSYWDMEVPTEE